MIRAHQLGGQRVKVKKLKKPGLTKDQQKAKDEYEALKAKWAGMPKFSGKYEVDPTKLKVGKQTAQPPKHKLVVGSAEDRDREAERQARYVAERGGAGKAAVPQYTGTKMLGIGQLHKSNAVPVFQADDAIDIARMRR